MFVTGAKLNTLKMPKPEKTHQEDEGDKSHKLTNADFRKLLMTPRTTPATMPTMVSNSATANKPQEILKTIPKTEGEDKAERRRKKKIFYAKLKKQEDDKMAELAEKYRDRAKERRDGQNPDYQVEDPLSVASGYRAVAPDVKSGMDAAERRRQMIQESKFLGGDMEHTHLVKGLDYALLQKVRSEIQMKEIEVEEEMELIVSKPIKKEKKKDENEIQFKTRLGRNIYRTALGNKEVERNPMFAPGRMAYVIELQDDMIDTDIPTTVIRSKADVPSLEEKPMLTTNDIVINKLAQILSYLRQGPKHSRKARRRERLQVRFFNVPLHFSFFTCISTFSFFLHRPVKILFSPMLVITFHQPINVQMTKRKHPITSATPKLTNLVTHIKKKKLFRSLNHLIITNQRQLVCYLN